MARSEASEYPPNRAGLPEDPSTAAMPSTGIEPKAEAEAMVKDARTRLLAYREYCTEQARRTEQVLKFWHMESEIVNNFLRIDVLEDMESKQDVPRDRRGRMEGEF